MILTLLQPVLFRYTTCPIQEIPTLSYFFL